MTKKKKKQQEPDDFHPYQMLLEAKDIGEMLTRSLGEKGYIVTEVELEVDEAGEIYARLHGRLSKSTIQTSEASGIDETKEAHNG